MATLCLILLLSFVQIFFVLRINILIEIEIPFLSLVLNHSALGLT